MGLLSGSATYTRFLLRDDPTTAGFRARFEKAVAHHVFVPLRVEDDEDQRVGWCHVRDAFVTELVREHFLFADHVHLGVRIDRWKVPRNLLKARVAEGEQALMDKLGVGRLSRVQKEDVKVFALRGLRKQTLPSTRHVELSWELASGVVRVFSTSKAVLGLVDELFEKTFKLPLAPFAIPTMMERLEADEETLARLAKLEPAAAHRLSDEEGA